MQWRMREEDGWADEGRGQVGRQGKMGVWMREDRWEKRMETLWGVQGIYI